MLKPQEMRLWPHIPPVGYEVPEPALDSELRATIEMAEKATLWSSDAESGARRQRAKAYMRGKGLGFFHSGLESDLVTTLR